MKKLLVLSLVLGIASLASAAFTLSAPKTELTPGESVQLELINSLGGIEGFALGYLIVPDSVPGVLSDAAILANGGNQSSANPYTEAFFGTGYEISLADTNPGGAGLVAGPQVGVLYTAPIEVGTYDVEFYNDALGYSAPEAVISFTVIPEPATMALLGLGALVLRRKK